jgi:hypothetical protein
VAVARISLFASLIAMTMLAGCGGDKGPTAAEASQKLKTDITGLLRNISAHNTKVIQDGSQNMPCGKHKAKRTYTVTASQHTSGGTPRGLLGLMIGSMVGNYKLTRVESTGTTALMRNNTAHTNVTLQSLSRGILTVTGVTDCLRT